ncbi:MAG: hypothetical protein KDK33_11745 [Leptospiraceae bacterium]|nr:hypothetical protein [Leptospiraceae bacterium]
MMAATTPQCLILDNSPPSDGPLGSLASFVSVLLPPAVYFFMDDSGGDGTARSFLKMDAGGNFQLKSWTGGPKNIVQAAVANGVIYALDGQNIDDVWISSDDGTNWTLVDTPSSNESEKLAHVIDCGGNVIVSHATISHTSGGSHPAYITKDGGLSWQEWRLGFGPASAGETSVYAMDCTSDRLFVAGTSSNTFQWAATPALNAWTQATAAPGVVYTAYGSIATSGTGVIGLNYDNGMFTGAELAYSTSFANGMASAGSMPHMGCGTCGNTEYGISSATNNRFFVSEADSTNKICRVYSSVDGSTAPASSTIAALDCSSVGTPGAMPGLLVSRFGIFTSYRNSTGTQTGLLKSSDGGATLTKVDLSSVWTDSGFITDIEESP